MVNIENVLEEVKKNNRVCPQPNRWNDIWEMLPNKERVGNGWKPALPLILAAWHDTPHLSKILRFKEHLEWAADNGNLEEVYQFLKNLNENEWYHTDE